MSTTAEERSREVTLNVLKRFDSHIQQYIGSSGHVALYEFDQAQMKWDRKDKIEGSLFVVVRDVQPWFQIFIMNKKSTDNFTEPVTADFAFEINMPYLMYKNDAAEVIGIWFFEPEECRDIEKLLHEVQASLRAQQQQQQMAAPAPLPPQPAPATNMAQDSANLMAALNIGGGGGAAAPTPAQPQGPAPAAQPQLLAPSFFNQASSAASAAPAQQGPSGDGTLQKLFARAANISGPSPQQSVPSGDKRDKVRAVMQRLLANDTFVDLITGELEAEGML